MKINVDIIIPCRNEENYIEKCIHSIFENKYPKELIHVFVVDGLSDDNTLTILNQLIKKYNNLKLLINEKQTTPHALNLGIKQTNHQVKIIFGAHAIMDENFINENIKILSQYQDVGCCGGIIENVYQNKTGEIIGKAMSSPFGVGDAHFRTGIKEGFVDTVAFGAYKNEVFKKVGLFDEELVRNQDDEFNFRLLKNGYKIYLSKKVKSKYFVRGSFKKLRKQYYQYGFWKVYVNKKHKTVTTFRQIVPLLFVGYIIFGLLFCLLFQKWTYLYLSGLVLYFLSALFFSLKKSKTLNEMFKIIYSFCIIHFSYGLGYLNGIIQFLFFKKRPKSNEKLTR
ncbi:MAG: glycosyltransferase family 2 protein [Vicingaceae bacterium]